MGLTVRFSLYIFVDFVFFNFTKAIRFDDLTNISSYFSLNINSKIKFLNAIRSVFILSDFVGVYAVVLTYLKLFYDF